MKIFTIAALLVAAVIANTARAQYGPQQCTTGGYTPGYSTPYKPAYGKPYTPVYNKPYKPDYTKPYKPMYTKPYEPQLGNTPGGGPGGTPGGNPFVGNPGGTPGAKTGVPQELQGNWFERSSNAGDNLFVYVVRADSYDMFEVDTQTGQVVVIDGEPAQVINGPLTFVNGVLHLSPGADVEEGPFNIQTADPTELVLVSLVGEQPRTLSRQP